MKDRARLGATLDNHSAGANGFIQVTWRIRIASASHLAGRRSKIAGIIPFLSRPLVSPISRSVLHDFRTELHPKSSFFETGGTLRRISGWSISAWILARIASSVSASRGNLDRLSCSLMRLSLSAPAKPWIGFYIDNRLATENVTNSRSVAQGNFFEPIHYVAQVVFTHLEKLSDLSRAPGPLAPS